MIEFCFVQRIKLMKGEKTNASCKSVHCNPARRRCIGAYHCDPYSCNEARRKFYLSRRISNGQRG